MTPAVVYRCVLLTVVFTVLPQWTSALDLESLGYSECVHHTCTFNSQATQGCIMINYAELYSSLL